MTECGLCFHRCLLSEGQRGLCRARSCKNGAIVCDNYGLITSAALDPIEKKPLRRFWPGKRILSLGSYGCNLRCPFCQNSDISMSDGETVPLFRVTPDEIARKAWELAAQDNIGVAYTYNEPTVGYEFVRDCAQTVHELGLKNVLVTNGSLLREPLERLLPFIDAMNVDIKSFSKKTYREVLSGDLDMTKAFIERAVKDCHVELTTLIVPGMNDTEEEIRELTGWIAELKDRDGNTIGTEVPYHVSRFFPRYKMNDKKPTDIGKIYELADIAREKLKYVYTGNC